MNWKKGNFFKYNSLKFLIKIVSYLELVLSHIVLKTRGKYIIIKSKKIKPTTKKIKIYDVAFES